ncbi:FkbM family methyltransferase [Burkholderia territorii]|uniref:FkbM family methyltransferase n=2 Tax=Burkholderia territorii TaxID=1503055 RepID=A0A108ESK4_9BURK|nr:FkbM family methyltransferase [Burkholderia territorii]
MMIYVTQQCRYGTMIFNRNDDTIGKSLIQYGEWSEAETFLFSQILRPGDAAVEIGANIGSHTVMLSQAVGDAGAVFAFEPQRHVFQVLCANLVINHCLNVYASQCAIGDADGMIDFPAIDPRHPNNFGATSIYLKNTELERISIKRLDSIDFRRIDFLKADVEGFELNVLRGGLQTIERHRPILHLEYLNHYTGDESRRYLDLLSPMDYRLWYYITPLYNRDNFLKNQDNIFEGIWSFDAIAIPAERGEMQGLHEIKASDDHVRCDDGEQWRSAKYIRY